MFHLPRSFERCQRQLRRPFAKRFVPAAPAPASSASATSACRSRSSSRRPASTPPASTSIARKVRSVNDGRSYIPDVPTADVQALHAKGRLDATTDFAIVARARHDQHLRADAAAQDEGPGHVLHRLGGRRRSRSTSIPGMLIVPRVDDLSGHDRRGRAADARGDGAEGRRRLLPRVLARARRSGQPDVPDAQHAEGRRRRHADLLAARGGALRHGDRDGRPGQLDPRRRDGEAAREHVPRGEHRPGERAGADVRPLGINVWEVVDAAATKPFGFMPFYPGPGLGGHCIPIDPFYLSWKAKQTGFEPRFIELAGHINAGMPHYVVDKVAEALNTRRKAVNGSQHPDRRRRLQARHRRHARVAGAGRDGAAARARREDRRTPIRGSPKCTAASGRAATTSRRST